MTFRMTPAAVLAAVAIICAVGAAPFPNLTPRVEKLHSYDMLPKSDFRKRIVTTVSFSSDGTRLAARLSTGIEVWDLPSKKLLFSQNGTYPSQLLLTPDGRQLIKKESMRGIECWDVESGKHLSTLCSRKYLVLSPDGSMGAIWSEKDTIERWDLRAFKRLPNFRLPDAGNGTSVYAFCPSGRYLVAAVGKFDWDENSGGTYRTIVYILYAHTGRLVQRIEVKNVEGIMMAAFSPDGRRLTCHTCEIPTAEELEQGEKTPGKDPDPKRIFRVRQWELVSGKQLYTITPEYPTDDSVLFMSPEGRVMLSDAGVHLPDKDRYRLYDCRTGELICRLDLLGLDSRVFAIRPAGPAFVSSGSKSLRVYPYGRLIPRLPEPTAISEAQSVRDWESLASSDINAARAAVWNLAKAPQQAIALLAKQLRPVEPVSDDRIRSLINDLDAEESAPRVRASVELARLGLRADSAVRAALVKPASLEAKRRLQRLVNTLDQPLLSQGDLRTLRAIEVLEHIGSDSARHLLRRLCGGAAGAIETEEARAALLRLAKKPREAKQPVLECGAKRRSGFLSG